MPTEPNPDRDERVKLPLKFKTALKALLAVDPDDEPIDQDQDEEGSRRAHKRPDDG